MIACLWEQFPIDLRRVHTVGFSVGGRFSAYLMGNRSETLGSFATWSGGDVTPQGIDVVPDATHPIPGLLFHGGPNDNPAPGCCGVDATASLAASMRDNGQLTIVCDHGGGHSLPGPANDRMADLLAYFLAHPFMPGNEAAWRDEGLPASFPGYCTLR